MEHTPESYIESLFAEDDELLQVLERIKRENMPEISVPPGIGRLLTMLVKITKAENILEIGALGGYSGICLARGLSAGGRLYSLELKPEYAALAKENMEAARLGYKVEYRIGDAKESLEQLKSEGKRFDLFFIDANKSAYPYYLEAAIELANPGALIVGDNTMQRGKVYDENATSSATRGMRKFNEMIATDPRLESTILPVYDGLAIGRVRDD